MKQLRLDFFICWSKPCIYKMLSIFGFSAGISVLFCFFLILWKHKHERFTADHTDAGPQKFHHAATPRVGGLSIFLGMIAGFSLTPASDGGLSWLLLVCVLPAWAAGLVEDFTKKVSPFKRLCAAFVVALLGAWLLNARLLTLGVPGIDYLLGMSLIFSIGMTMLMVGGITHSINIIDGFNGLAGGFVSMVLAALAYVTYQLNDLLLFQSILAMLGATLGFMVWNYPRGTIFAGDGGAYLWGGFIAEIILLLLIRHPQIPAWFGFLLLLYPIWETLFSMYRRKIVRGVSVGLPDGIHLHSLIFRRLIRREITSQEAKHLRRRNARTAPYLWLLSLFSIIPAVIFRNDLSLLVLSSIGFILLYGFIYQMIVRFKVWPWLTVR